MADWMEQLVDEAEKQGFTVSQADNGSWLFRKGASRTVTTEPTTATEWVTLFSTLRRAGLNLSEKQSDKET
ncbi:hypothetical protein ACGFNU_00920 [Spirillospora sp. NPDC048911]|uniref:hypothetical protein n=1 Tax=Spirillospora sp. NPDC048911 TaxID=3364527 RepID=UPI0037227383